MRKLIAIVTVASVLVCTLLFLPTVSFTENADTLQLARVIYALGRNESYDVKLAIGSVVMNRVDSCWFADTLSEVLDDPQQFPAGERYDPDSLKAAHEVVSGKRNLDPSILYYRSAATAALSAKNDAAVTVGDYNFYTSDSMLTVTGLL